MNSVTAEGRTYEEAVEHAIQKLGVRIDQVEVEVMEEKRGMLFGLFGGKVVVRVTHQSSTEDRIDEILSGIMKHLAIPSQVEVSKRGADYDVNIGTVDSDGLLIGKRGETLHALEHLVNRIVHKDPTERGRITVDVSGYRARRDEQLKTQASEMAKKARDSGREVSTDPLYSPDRRVIHLALTDETGIRTFTVGDGLAKAVVVAPAGSGGPSREGRSRGGRGRGGRGRGGRGRGRGRGRSNDSREGAGASTASADRPGGGGEARDGGEGGRGRGRSRRRRGGRGRGRGGRGRGRGGSGQGPGDSSGGVERTGGDRPSE